MFRLRTKGDRHRRFSFWAPNLVPVVARIVAQDTDGALPEQKNTAVKTAYNMKITLDYVLPQPSQGLFLVDLDI